MDVSIVRLDDVAEVRLGRQRSPKNHMGDSMRPYLRAANVGWGGLLLQDVKEMNFTDAEMSVYGLRPSDLLLNEASGSPREVGKPAMWDGEIEGCAFQNTLLRVRPRAAISSRYLLHFFKYEATSGKFADRSRGVGIRHLGREALARTAVPLPSLADQGRIADILDQADALCAKRREALNLLDSLAQSLFFDMFGDPIKNPQAWARVQLSDLLTGIDSGASPVCRDRPAEFDEWAVLKLGSVTKCIYLAGENKALMSNTVPQVRFEVRTGDILFSRKNTHELIAACVLVHQTPRRRLLPDLIFRLNVRGEAPVEKTYLQQLLVYPSKRRQIQALAGGSAGSMPNISKARLLAAEVELPPVDLQNEFGRRIRAVDAQREAQLTALSAGNDLFVSLQQRAFAGQL